MCEPRWSLLKSPLDEARVRGAISLENVLRASVEEAQSEDTELLLVSTFISRLVDAVGLPESSACPFQSTRNKGIMLYYKRTKRVLYGIISMSQAY